MKIISKSNDLKVNDAGIIIIIPIFLTNKEWRHRKLSKLPKVMCKSSDLDLVGWF